MISSIHDTDANVTVTIELRMRRDNAASFVAAMTGDDDDILLAAEHAMNDRIKSLGDLQLSFTDDDRHVKDDLKFEAIAEATCQRLYGPRAS